MINDTIPDDDEINTRLIKSGDITPPSNLMEAPPMTEDEIDTLADFVGSAGRPLSEVIIE